MMLEEHKHKHATHDFDGITENRVNSPPAYFNVLFYGLILWGIAFMAYFLFSGWSSDAEFQAKMTDHQQQAAAAAPAVASGVTSSAGPDLAAGAKTFASTCAMCHGAEGEGGIGPDLTRAEFSYGKTEADIRQTITKGRPNGMPAFGSQLSGNELDNVIAFVLSLK
jgi:cytochrome c oxidase cbb3-type subunit III